MTISFVRTIILYILIIAALRAMGKRQVGELSPSEFVVTLLVSELATIPMQSTSVPLLHGIIPILTLLALEIIISTIFIRSSRIRKFAVGKINILIENGKLKQDEMRKLRITLDELLEEIRLKGYLNISDIKYAILEANGELSVFPFSKNDYVTREDMNITEEKNFLPHTLISDGVYIESEVTLLGKDEKWVFKKLKKENISSIADVFLMQADTSGKTLIIPKEKKK